MLISLLENIHKAAVLLLVLCSFLYYRQLKKVKRERNLSSFEFTMYILTQLAYFLWAGSLLLLLFGT
ncbi:MULTISPECIES: hypothetical protein [unclassified Bacillus (in: firmicutes)]|uniref:hypothetical protein n=1 Tax=unclassified Bacillus (in: firmicutes) TaxID=185979 RepID=UPI001FCDC5BC|nr:MULTISPECIES: hypothetical protein [unclassified Bacillus (in: firmicutes)]